MASSKCKSRSGVEHQSKNILQGSQDNHGLICNRDQSIFIHESVPVGPPASESKSGLVKTKASSQEKAEQCKKFGALKYRRFHVAPNVVRKKQPSSRIKKKDIFPMRKVGLEPKTESKPKTVKEMNLQRLSCQSQTRIIGFESSMKRLAIGDLKYNFLAFTLFSWLGLLPIKFNFAKFRFEVRSGVEDSTRRLIFKIVLWVIGLRLALFEVMTAYIVGALLWIDSQSDPGPDEHSTAGMEGGHALKYVVLGCAFLAFVLILLFWGIFSVFIFNVSNLVTLFNDLLRYFQNQIPVDGKYSVRPWREMSLLEWIFIHLPFNFSAQPFLGPAAIFMGRQVPVTLIYWASSWNESLWYQIIASGFLLTFDLLFLCFFGFLVYMAGLIIVGFLVRMEEDAQEDFARLKAFESRLRESRKVSGDAAPLWAIVDALRVRSLRTSIFNLTGSDIIYMIKLGLLAASILGGFVVVRVHKNDPLMAGVAGVVFVYGISFYTVIFGRASRIQENAKEIKLRVLQVVLSLTTAKKKQKFMELEGIKKTVRSIRDRGLWAGGFNEIEKEATPIFIDHVINEVLNLLLTF